jgi:hypothetical protein
VDKTATAVTSNEAEKKSEPAEINTAAESSKQEVVVPMPDPLPGMVSSPPSIAPTVAMNAPTPARSVWLYEGGQFARQAAGEWKQTVEEKNYIYREVSNSESFIELEHRDGAGRIRLYATYSEIKRNGADEFVKFKEGKWESPQPRSLADLAATQATLPPEVRQTLDQAIALHKKQQSDARTKMIKTFENMREKVKREKAISSEDRLKLLERLEVEQAAFEKAGYLPFSNAMRALWPGYVELVNIADFRLQEAFERQLAIAVKDENKEQAELIIKERETFFKPTVIARWDDWTMYSNGKMHHNHWRGNTWKLKGNRIDLSGGDRWTISALGEKVSCVNQFNIHFSLSWRPPE